jgi:Fe2+ transport system protein B
MTTYARLVYNGKVQTVALYEGLNKDELISLLQTVFSIDGNIVGFMAEVCAFFPLVHSFFFVLTILSHKIIFAYRKDW